jgi:hypothetical protein
MEQDATGLKLLKNINIKGFEKAADHEWDDVRVLNINLISQ